MSPLLHVAGAALRADLDPAARESLLAYAHGLAAAEAAEASWLGLTPDALITATWLRPLARLEDFAAAPEHMAFVMQGLARTASDVWTVSISTSAEPPQHPGFLQGFAFGATDAYDWQVRELLEAIDGLPGVSAAGSTIEERDRFRLGGVVVLMEDEQVPFLEGWSAIEERALALGGELRTVCAPVLP